MERVQGYCPMGCGQTLFLGDGGHVTCSHLSCADPCAVDQLLDNGETEHIVEFGEETFGVQHPLKERLGGDLFTCQLHGWIRSLPGPPVELPGRYRAIPATVGWTFVEITS